MSIHDFNSQRLFLDEPLTAGTSIDCCKEHSNYLKNVMRLKVGNHIFVFNGQAGEWRAEISLMGKKSVQLQIIEQIRQQVDGPDIDFIFAPLKRSRLDYMAQKATEMGAARLAPVLTCRTNAGRVNINRLRANAIAAAEQCGILRIPEISAPVKLAQMLAQWDTERMLIFCDEAAEQQNPLNALTSLPDGPMAVLIGPEGGFTPQERQLLRAEPFTVPISMGPRIMRADTAAIAALALVNAAKGDWRSPGQP